MGSFPKLSESCLGVREKTSKVWKVVSMSDSVRRDGRLAALTAALAYLEIVGGVRRPVWRFWTTVVQEAMSRRVRLMVSSGVDVGARVVVWSVSVRVVISSSLDGSAGWGGSSVVEEEDADASLRYLMNPPNAMTSAAPPPKHATFNGVVFSVG